MLGFIPWGAIISTMLVIGGLCITVIKGKAAGDTATALLAAAGSSNSGVFPKGVEVYNASWVVSLGLAGGCIAVLLLTAGARLVQKLRKAGKSSKGARGCWPGSSAGRLSARSAGGGPAPAVALTANRRRCVQASGGGAALASSTTSPASPWSLSSSAPSGSWPT